MLQVLFPNESVPIILARMIGTIGPIDMEMLAFHHPFATVMVTQSTSKLLGCFC